MWEKVFNFSSLFNLTKIKIGHPNASEIEEEDIRSLETIQSCVTRRCFIQYFEKLEFIYFPTKVILVF